ncbi:MAG: hypothetical protein ACTSRU_09030 [Candidatus Hodarchaeales archaeon]
MTEKIVDVKEKVICKYCDEEVDENRAIQDGEGKILETHVSCFLDNYPIMLAGKHEIVYLCDDCGSVMKAKELIPQELHLSCSCGAEYRENDAGRERLKEMTEKMIEVEFDYKIEFAGTLKKKLLQVDVEESNKSLKEIILDWMWDDWGADIVHTDIFSNIEVDLE